MSFLNLVKTSLLSIKAYKLRIFLTMLGIIIGISSVSAILAIGEGLKKKSTESFENADMNKTVITFYSDNQMMEAPFNRNQFPELKKIEGVKKVEATDPSESFYGGAGFYDIGIYDKTSNVLAKNYSSKDKVENVGFGRNMTDEEKKGDDNIIILPMETAKELLGEGNEESIVGKGVTVNGRTMEVIGLFPEKNMDESSAFSSGMPMEAIVPKKTVLKEEKEIKDIQAIKVYMDLSARDREETIAELKEKLAELNPEIQGDYVEQDAASMIKETQKIVGQITMFVALITGISLLVGGIGVMNIMYVSVTERRREIGIRRAIGAKQTSIMTQFLIESMFITGLGGLIGIAIGYGITKIASLAMPFSPVLTPKNFLLASSVSIVTGIIFGIVPAYKASKLDPIKAIYR